MGPVNHFTCILTFGFKTSLQFHIRTKPSASTICRLSSISSVSSLSLSSWIGKLMKWLSWVVKLSSESELSPLIFDSWHELSGETTWKDLKVWAHVSGYCLLKNLTFHTYFFFFFFFFFYYIRWSHNYTLFTEWQEMGKVPGGLSVPHFIPPITSFECAYPKVHLALEENWPDTGYSKLLLTNNITCKWKRQIVFTAWENVTLHFRISNMNIYRLVNRGQNASYLYRYNISTYYFDVVRARWYTSSILLEGKGTRISLEREPKLENMGACLSLLNWEK